MKSILLLVASFACISSVSFSMAAGDPVGPNDTEVECVFGKGGPDWQATRDACAAEATAICNQQGHSSAYVYSYDDGHPHDDGCWMSCNFGFFRPFCGSFKPRFSLRLTAEACF